MATKELGAQVLTKIENLITEIDKPAPPSNRRKQGHISFEQVVQDEDEKSKIYSKMSYVYRKKDKRIDEVLKDHVYQKQEYHQKFKVTNKNTLKILNKKEIKPIHQRVGQIIAKKKTYIKGVQAYYDQKQKEQMRPTNYADLSADKKFNEQELQGYCFELDEKNKERIKKKHMRKLDLVKKEDSKIPTVDKISRSLSVMRNFKKKYSDNVFQRMEEYYFEQRKKKRQLILNRTQEQGNFSPVLCSKSIQLAYKVRNQINKSKKSLHHQSRCQIQRHSPPKDKKLNEKQNKSIPKYIDKIKSKVKIQHKSKSVKKLSFNNNNKSFEKSALSKNISPLKEKNVNQFSKGTPKTTTTKKMRTISKSPNVKKQQKQN